MAKKAKAKKKPRAGGTPRRPTAKPSPRTVAASRRALQRRVRADRAQRYKEYRAWLTATPRWVRAGVAEARPLRILAEGDSWFEYPVPGGGGGVIVQLKDLIHLKILNMAHHGDEVRQMLALSQREEILKRLTDSEITFDALLFSGGGNDLVGDQFVLWLRDSQPGVPPEDLLDGPRVEAALGVVEAGYRDLITMRDQHSPNTRIFFHGYDFPRVTGKGVCGVGPWLKPSLDFRGIHDPEAQFRVVRALLLRFASMLQSLAAPPKNVFYVQTQGTLNPDADWANEIHPTAGGFKKIAQRFRTALKAQFPQMP